MSKQMILRRNFVKTVAATGMAFREIDDVFVFNQFGDIERTFFAMETYIVLMNGRVFWNQS